MSPFPLSLVDAARTEFGFARTVCACRECTLNCRHLPGYLIPADLDRIRRHLAPDEDLFAWANRHLLASPGAKVARQGRVFRIATLVPARQAGGACMFLTAEDRCAIHAVAPFGCAFVDDHMAGDEADRRSLRGLQAVLEAWSTGGLYAQVWIALDSAGLQALPPELGRQRLRHALDQQPVVAAHPDPC